MLKMSCWHIRGCNVVSTACLVIPAEMEEEEEEAPGSEGTMWIAATNSARQPAAAATASGGNHFLVALFSESRLLFSILVVKGRRRIF